MWNKHNLKNLIKNIYFKKKQQTNKFCLYLQLIQDEDHQFESMR